MRLDRLITLAVSRPLVPFFTPKPRRLPVLMYHSISDEAEPGRSGYYKVCTSPERFRDQMQWLADNNYLGVTLQAGLEWLDAEPTTDQRPRVAITFDDGFQDFYASAYPVLQQRNFQTTMYLATAYIGEQRRQFQSRDCLTWREIEELHAAGIEFGSHTVTHPKLIECGWAQVESELRESKAEIEQRLGAHIGSFAYPFAFPQPRKDFVGRLHQTLKASGYQSCATTEVGRVDRSHDRFSLKRLPVNQDDDLPLFRAKITGAYDWFALPQTAAKAIRHIIRRPYSRFNSRDAAAVAAA